MIKVSFSTVRYYLSFFTCIPGSWILLSLVVNLIYFLDVDVDERVPGLCIPLFRSVNVGGYYLSQTITPLISTTMSISNETLSALSESSRACIERLCKCDIATFEWLPLLAPNQYVTRFDSFGPMRPRRPRLIEANRLLAPSFTQIQA